MSEHNTAHGAHESHHHVSSAGQYWGIYGALMVLTAITVLAYYVPLWLNLNLGAANVIIAMAIATTKATLVCLYFMHLKYDKKFNLIAFLSSLIFLGLFLGFTLLDINTREDAQPFAKPLYAGKEIPLEGGHSSEGAKESAAPKAEGAATAPKAEAANAAAPAASAASSPAASASAGGAKKEEAKPTTPAAPTGGAKH